MNALLDNRAIIGGLADARAKSRGGHLGFWSGLAATWHVWIGPALLLALLIVERVP